MDPVFLVLFLILLTANCVLSWMRFVIERAAYRANFNQFAMNLDRFLDGDEKVRAKLLQTEAKLRSNI